MWETGVPFPKWLAVLEDYSRRLHYSPHCDLAISFGNSLIAPTEDARSLGVILDGLVSLSAHIANLTWSCRYLLYNIRRIRPFLSQEATQLLVQSLVISRLDYCNSLLAGLPLQAIRPLQLVQNAAARLIFNLPKFTHITPLLRSLHWLPVVTRIRFKTLVLAYKAKNGPAPPYLMAMVKSRSVPRALRASSTVRLEPPPLRTHGGQASRLFSVLAPRWWNQLPLSVRTAESLAVFKRRLKTHLFIMHLSTSTDPLFGQCLSSCLNTGVPQGCVLSPILYSLFSHDCVPIYGSNTIIKYADDTTVIGLIRDNDETAYRDEIQHLSTWCHDNNLTLNTQKTKEIIMDLGRSRSQAHPPVYISGAAVEQVTSFKFLGTHISSDLTWSLNSSVLVKKAQQRLYFL
ncbi:hypothetical protein NFI96_007016, partial [Prochilodus magdalenae]